MIINNKSSYYFTYSVIYGKNFISNLKSSMSTKKDKKKIKKTFSLEKKKKKKGNNNNSLTWHDLLTYGFLSLIYFQFILSNKLVN